MQQSIEAAGITQPEYQQPYRAASTDYSRLESGGTNSQYSTHHVQNPSAPMHTASTGNQSNYAYADNSAYPGSSAYTENSTYADNSAYAGNSTHSTHSGYPGASTSTYGYSRGDSSFSDSYHPTYQPSSGQNHYEHHVRGGVI